MAESRHLCPRRDLSVDAGLSPAQFQVRPIPQHYQHYLATPRMHHFPRNSSSTQMVSEGLYQETRCLLGARGPEACGSLCPAPCVPFPGPAPYVLPSVSPFSASCPLYPAPRQVNCSPPLPVSIPTLARGERKGNRWTRGQHCWQNRAVPQRAERGGMKGRGLWGKGSGLRVGREVSRPCMTSFSYFLRVSGH